jgi:anti-sigma regulatory factor (Ser/Thr protein kinase)
MQGLPKTPAVSETYRAIAGSVGAARAAVVELAHRAGAAGEQIDAIATAASEALTNVVRACVSGRSRMHPS